MLFNVTHHDAQVAEQIRQCVGRRFSIFSRFKLGRLQSQHFFIAEADRETADILRSSNNRHICHLQLREKGLLVRFRIRLETYAIAMPYRLISLFKGGNYIQVFAGNKKLKLKPTSALSFDQRFVMQMIKLKYGKQTVAQSPLT